MTSELISIILLLILSAIYSSTETALLALSKAKILEILEQRKDRPKTLKLWVDRPNLVLTGILVGNNFVNILASSLATKFTEQALSHIPGAWVVAVAVGVMTLLILTFGEVVPKTFAKHNPERLIPLLGLTYATIVVFRPLIWLLMQVAKPTIKAVGGKYQQEGPLVSEQEIEQMIRIGADEGIFSKDKGAIYESLLDFSETQAKEIMVPRTEIVGFSVDMPIDEVIRVTSTTKFSRYPVYEGDLDHIQGILLAKDLLRIVLFKDKGGRSLHLRDLLRQAYFVPETKRIGELLREFQTTRNQMAIVVDEWGGTSGLVTMEDVIEEIVGEIYDEYDRAEEFIKMISEDTFLINGKAPLEEVSKVMGVEFPEQDDYETIGGFLMDLTGRVPNKDDVIIYQNVKFRIRDRTKTRIVVIEAHKENTQGRKGKEVK